ncbi:B12-binding domain-containing radical SAM protein [Saprospiraceae bacterium]|nr:B12-binding domain-containing radical SAM protein [Saprospiraceae bacterium]
MKVLLTHTYFLNDDPKEQQINKPYPPLGLLYLSAWLEKSDYNNEVFDATFSSKKKQRDYILKNQPNVIAIYANLITKLNVIELVRFIRSQEKLKNCLIVLGGPDVTYNIENYLSFGADVLVIGEGEQTLLEVVQAHEKGFAPQFGHISGLAFKDESGSIIKTVKRSHLRQIDELPIPNRKKIDLSLYLDLWKKHHGRNSISLSTQRGCPYTCRWCSTAVYGQSYRRRSPKLVVEEMQFLKKNYDFDQIWFVDDVFTVSHKWLNSFYEELQKQNVQVPFECITRADRLTEEVLKILKDCGCFRVWIGAESGSQKIIDAMDRRVTTSQVQDMIIAARQNGMETGTFIMLGYPGETEKDIQLTLEHLCRAKPDHFTITVAYPIRGTSLYKDVENLFLDQQDWYAGTDRDLDFLRTYPRQYYDFAVRWVVNGVYFYQQKSKGNLWNWTVLKFGIKKRIARLGMSWYRLFGVKKSINEVSSKISKTPKSILSDS